MSREKSVAENLETVEIVEEALHSVWAIANKLSRIAPPEAKAYADQETLSSFISNTKVIIEELSN